MRILIAEDESDLAEALSVFFEKNQFSADVVNDGLSAYDYARGFGIGLSLARSIAEAHNGSITARSEDGKTVEFTVLLR